MNDQELLLKFSGDLQQEVISRADSDEVGEFRVDQFTQLAAEYLIEAGEVDDISVCYFKSRGMQMNGVNISEDEGCVDLFISVFNHESPPVIVTRTQCDTAFKQAMTCFKKALLGFHTSLEEASEVYDVFQRLHELKDRITRCRIYLLTDGIVKQDTFAADPEEDISIYLNVWDIQRLYRFVSSGKKFEPIEIDFEEEFDNPVPCLPLADMASDYQGYLAVIPGAVLSGIYDKYGPRLLERNVRSFLQARGKVNKGIRKTILEEPHRFFAYNNGITATADDIEFVENADGLKIKKIRNLQIVNGGQTTASLYHTAKKDKANLDHIYIQTKLSVIPEEHVEEIVPLISRYANSQNKVNDADFYANDPFHVSIEELSRTIWAPAVGGTSRQTRWFYERARGQYLDAKARETTPARKRQFEALSPNRQKFTKTDLAKVENVWMQLPHIVCLGAQKNFNNFAIQLKERGRVTVDVTYFEHLIAKTILFKKTDKIVRDQRFGDYKAQIVSYTIAWLSHHTSQRIDLGQIWKEQDISPALQEAIRIICTEVHRLILNVPSGRNIAEWCKRKECWDSIKNAPIKLSDKLQDEFIDIGPSSPQRPDKGIEGPNDEDLQLIRIVEKISADQWFQISKWAKETNNLQPWQRSLSFSIGRVLGRAGAVSPKQARQGVKILEEAKTLGFKL